MPHKLDNAFLSDAEPWKDDIIIFAQGDALMVAGEPEKMRFPKRQEIRSNKYMYQYLFSLDGHGVYHGVGSHVEPLEGFTYRTLRGRRQQLRCQQQLPSAAYTAPRPT